MICVMDKCCFFEGITDDGDSKHVWNVGQRLPKYMAQHPIRQL